MKRISLLIQSFTKGFIFFKKILYKIQVLIENIFEPIINFCLIFFIVFIFTTNASSISSYISHIVPSSSTTPDPMSALILAAITAATAIIVSGIPAHKANKLRERELELKEKESALIWDKENRQRIIDAATPFEKKKELLSRFFELLLKDYFLKDDRERVDYLSEFYREASSLSMASLCSKIEEAISLIKDQDREKYNFIIDELKEMSHNISSDIDLDLFSLQEKTNLLALPINSNNKRQNILNGSEGSPVKVTIRSLRSTELIKIRLWFLSLSKANLREANLRRAKLIKRNLREADLKGADLREADLRGANLREADLRGADLREADLRGADLREADLRGADLREADLKGANLIGADLKGASLKKANLSYTDLSEADLKETDLTGADLIGTNLIRANLIGANLTRTDLIGADLKEAKLIGADLNGTDLKKANLNDACLNGADLSSSDNLTQEQIDSSITDKDTKLPNHIKQITIGVTFVEPNNNP
jgi:uncharacterized protein YjbI with pentapeptide repeats